LRVELVLSTVATAHRERRIVYRKNFR
jgi:hypothetical protein